MPRLRSEVRAVAPFDEQRGQAEVPAVRLAEDESRAERVRGGGRIGWEIGSAGKRADVRSMRWRTGIVLDVIVQNARYRKNW
jgi:hypothetical protein